MTRLTRRQTFEHPTKTTTDADKHTPTQQAQTYTGDDSQAHKIYT